MKNFRTKAKIWKKEKIQTNGEYHNSKERSEQQPTEQQREREKQRHEIDNWEKKKNRITKMNKIL